jgi:hypothetical protein
MQDVLPLGSGDLRADTPIHPPNERVFVGADRRIRPCLENSYNRPVSLDK